LHLHISKKQINLAFSDLSAQGWVEACNTLAIDEEIQVFKVFLTEIRGFDVVLWKHFRSSKDPWLKFLEQRAQHGERYWRNHVRDYESSWRYSLTKLCEHISRGSPKHVAFTEPVGDASSERPPEGLS